MTIDCLQILIFFLHLKKKVQIFKNTSSADPTTIPIKCLNGIFHVSKQDFWVQDEVHLKSRLMSFPSAG